VSTLCRKGESTRKHGWYHESILQKMSFGSVSVYQKINIF